MAIFSESVRGRKTILLLSGTSEGPPLARSLSEAGYQVRATVTRLEACTHLFANLPPEARVEVRGFNEESLADFLLRKEADAVLDATHPFAVRITSMAHAVCARLGVPYVRYERPDWLAPEGTHLVDSFAKAALKLAELGRRTMLTIGSKQLKHFVHLQERLPLFARVLPSPLSLEQALGAGFRGDRLIGLRPPFSLEFNQALFREYQAEVLVSKASGYEGGVVEKVNAARGLNMQVLMIQRPAMPDLPTVCTLEGAVAEITKRLASSP